MFTKIKNIHYKELLLYGFYISYIFLVSLAGLIDFLIHNYMDATLEFSSVLLTMGIFYNYSKSKNHELAAIALFWIASFLVFLFLIHNEFDIGVIFTVILPLVAFLLLSVKRILFHVGIYYLLLILIFIYGYTMYDTHSLLYEPKRMNAYVIANLFVIAFGIFYHLAIEQSYRELEIANRQKTFLLKEIHHRVKNNLNIISSILGIQKLESHSPEVHTLIDQNRLRLESMAMAHEILYRCDDLVNIDFGVYIEKLTQHILKVESRDEKIELKLEITALSLSIEKMIQFGMIINELITNSLKYAFVECEGVISIRLIKEKKGYIFSYADNGQGFHDEKMRKGFGSSLIEIAVEQLNGVLSIKNENGVTYTIILKGLIDENINC